MNLKTSFFNKSIFRSDLKRLWWVSALEWLMIFLTSAFPIMDDLLEVTHFYDYNAAFNDSIFMRYIEGPVIFAIIASAGLAVFLFSYINSPKAVSAMHGLPIRRENLFVSHVLSGMVLFALPVLANTLILLIFRLSGIGLTVKISHIFMFGTMILIYSLLAFSGTAAVTMLTGNNVAALVFAGIIAIIPLVTESFISYFLQNQLYGYSNSYDMHVSKFLYVEPNRFWQGAQNSVKYVAFSVILLVAALLLYRIRKLENNNEVLAFPKLRPIFVYLAALYIGGMGYIYLGEMWEITSVLLFIPLGIIGIVAAEMLTKKSLRIKGAFKPAVIFCAAICVTWLGFKFDVSGYEKRVPSVNSVKSVQVYSNVSAINCERVHFTSDGVEVKYNDSYATFTAEDEISNIIALHKKLTEEKTEVADDSFTITYNLANGRTLQRFYHINLTEQKDLLKPILESRAMRETYLPILRDVPREITEISVSDVRMPEPVEYYANDTDAVNKIINALKEDAANTSYESFAPRGDELTKIRISFKRTDAVYKNSGKPVSTEDLPEISETYQIHKDYKNTMAVLEELGINNRLKTASDVKKILVDFWGGSAAFLPEDKEITDPDEIAEIYDNLEKIHFGVSNYSSGYNATLNIFFKSETNGNNETYAHSSSLLYDRNQDGLPKVLAGED